MSGLEDLYKEVILDHYRNPRCRGELPVPPAVSAEGFNPLCGDEITVYCDVEDDRLTRIRITSRGCSISTSSASMMAETLEGCTLDEVRQRTAMFHTLMSIHEASLGADTGELDEDGLPADGSDGHIDETALGDLVALRGVLRYPRRIKCATLGWNTLTRALADVEG